VICSVDNDRKHALDMARKMMTQYLGQQPHLMKASGVSQELLDEIHQVLTWPATEEEIEGAMHLVPDDVVQMCTASGSPDEVKAKVREYISSGATCPILYPLGDPKLMIDIFSPIWQRRRLAPGVAQQRHAQRKQPDGLVPVVERALGVAGRCVEHGDGDNELVEEDQKNRPVEELGDDAVAGLAVFHVRPPGNNNPAAAWTLISRKDAKAQRCRGAERFPLCALA
jgi:hypothetical protein